MKIAKRVLATVMAVLMIVGSVALAASAEGAAATNAANLQSKVNAGGSVPVANDIWGSIEITKDVTIDLQGHKLNGTPGSEAVIIKDGANVTIKNGYVISRFTQYTDADEDVLQAADTVIEHSPAAIKAESGKVTLENVRVTGSNTRVPYTQEAIPTGIALVLTGNATAELKGASLMGRYGVSNANGGSVKIVDATIVAIMQAVTGAYTIPDSSEKVIAADLADTAFLVNGATVSENTAETLRWMLSDRAMIVTQKATDDNAILTIDNVNNYAYVTAQSIAHPNAYSDCSYTLVPLRACVWNQGGDTKEFFALGAQVPIAKVEGKDVRVQYQIQFDLQADIYDHVNGGYSDIAYTYNELVNIADGGYADAIAAYDKIVDQFIDLYGELEELASGSKTVEVGGQTYTVDLIGDEDYQISEAEFQRLKKDILDIGGVTVYNGLQDKAKAQYPEDAEMFNYMNTDSSLFDGWADVGIDPTENAYFAADEDGFVTSFGILDVIDAIKTELVDAVGDSFAFQGTAEDSNWGDVALALVNNYKKIFDLIPEAIAVISNLANDIENGSDTLKSAVNELGEDSPLAMLETYKGYLSDAEYTYNLVKNNADMADVFAYLDSNAADIAHYANMAGDFLTNPQKYIDLDEYLDGDTLKAYFVYGPTQLKTIDPADLHVKVTGTAGTISFAGSDLTVSDNLLYVDVPFSGTITMTATAGNGSQFLYWKNGETRRIMSTNPTMTLTTGLERYIEAVFASPNASEAILTTNSGAIMWQGGVTNGKVSLANAEAPFTPGRTGSTWGSAGVAVGGEYDVSGVGAEGYLTGNSAFDELGVIYDGAGYAFAVSSTALNKYILTPKYGNAEKHALYYNDMGKNRGNPSVEYGMALSYTARGTGFSYWADENNDPVSVYPNYMMLAVKDRTVRAVYGDSGNEAVANQACVNIVRTDSNPEVFYVERSVASSKTVLSHGIVYGINLPGETPFGKDDLKVENVKDNDLILKSVSTNTDNFGLYAVRPVSEYYTSGCSITARGFVELSDGSIIYSPVAKIG